MFGPAPRVGLLLVAVVLFSAPAAAPAQLPPVFAQPECSAFVASLYSSVQVFGPPPNPPIAGRLVSFDADSRALYDRRINDDLFVNDVLELLDDAGNAVKAEPESSSTRLVVQLPTAGTRLRARYSTVLAQHDGPNIKFCRLTFLSAPVTTEPSSVKVSGLAADDWSGSTHDSIRAAALSFDRTRCGNERIRLRVWSGNRQSTFTSGPGCVFGTSRIITQATKLQTRVDSGRLLITLKRSGRVGFSVTVDGRQRAAGSFRVRYSVEPGTPGYRIYNTDFDNYINTCINGSYRTYASGGRLYCYVKGSDPFPESVVYDRRIQLFE